MGKVAITYRIMPTSVDVNMDDLENSVKSIIPEDVRLVKTDIRPIAFGLKALMVTVVLEDEKGGVVEELLGKVENVESVEVENLTLI